MRFKDIIGHEEVKERLRRMADNDRIPHALLFSGKSGIGKMLIARAFVQYLACENHQNGDACGECPSCRQINALNFPDVYYVFPIVKKKTPKREISADCYQEWNQYLSDFPYMPLNRWMEALDAGNTQPKIYVTESAEILRRLSLSAYNSKYKVTIIWLPELMNTEAANKLLKIIEEPYSDSLFILVSNEPDKILPTILSRTQRISFHPLNDNQISDYLQQSKGLDNSGATAISRLAQGSLGNALENIDSHVEVSEFRDLFQNIMRAAYSRRVAELKTHAETISAMGRDKSCRFLTYMGAMLRENYIYNQHQPELNLLSEQEEAFSARFAPYVNETNIVTMIKSVDKACNDIPRNANAKIVCFDLMLKLLIYIRTK